MRRVCFAKALAAPVTCVVLALGVIGPAWASNKVVLSPYAPFPKLALTDVGAALVRPTHAEGAGVRVSVSRAYAVGLSQVGYVPKGAKVTLRLGLFRDTMMGPPIVWVLAYVVIFDGVVVPNLGPNGGPGGHELVVVVNAHTGKSMETFSYR